MSRFGSMESGGLGLVGSGGAGGEREADTQQPSWSRSRTHYAAGAMASPLTFTRKWLGDRFYDTVLNRMVS
ncbi:MAG: hypothetical protein P8189_27455 [Anaerolineae bacterium]